MDHVFSKLVTTENFLREHELVENQAIVWRVQMTPGLCRRLCISLLGLLLQLVKVDEDLARLFTQHHLVQKSTLELEFVFNGHLPLLKRNLTSLQVDVTQMQLNNVPAVGAVILKTLHELAVRDV